MRILKADANPNAQWHAGGPGGARHAGVVCEVAQLRIRDEPMGSGPAAPVEKVVPDTHHRRGAVCTAACAHHRLPQPRRAKRTWLLTSCLGVLGHARAES